MPKDGEMLEKLYSDISPLMLLAIRDWLLIYVMLLAGMRSLKLQGTLLACTYFGKAPTTMEEALHIALNLKALDKSKEAEVKALVGPHGRVVKEHKKKKDRYAKVVAKSVSTPSVGVNLLELRPLWLMYPSCIIVRLFFS